MEKNETLSKATNIKYFCTIKFYCIEIQVDYVSAFLGR